MKHPNTVIGGGVGGGSGLLATWILDRAGVHVSQEAGAGIAMGAASVLLFIGRRGVRDTLVGVWNGFGSAWGGADDPAPTPVAAAPPAPPVAQ